MIKKALVLLSTATLLSACSTPQSNAKPLLPNKSIQLTSNLSLQLNSMLVAAAIYYIYDPLAPNWEIREAQLSEDTYRFSLKMKRYHTGGAGESFQILKRRASQLQAEQGFAAYQLMEYTEGIESETLGAHRVAEGTIKLVQRQQADSFMQNARN